ncbi:hypothetical protein BGZ60DRAFT_416034 [Tricladium varicosporioides]|nr:hypothetical protein BGZ60DRAFT_416034 [Hymenoscyphus varicosporioides]
MTFISWGFVALLTGVTATPRDPFPFCSECLPAAVYDAPGIGFDLTHSYGTSAAHLVNGSVLDLSRVIASPDYTNFLSRLVDTPRPPALTFLEKWRRSLNKRLGRPATPEVGVLAGVLLSLRDETVAALSPSLGPSFRLDYVAVTGPPLSGLRREDLSDALEYASLRSWLDPPQPGQGLQAGMYPEALGEAHVAVAADGNGLCVNYRDLFMCWDEEERMPSNIVLIASFTRRALYVAAGVVRAPLHWVQPPLVHTTDLKAGLESMAAYGTPSEFWAHIRGGLRNVAQQALASTDRGLTKVLLLGENATNPDFLDALRESVADLIDSQKSRGTVIRESVLADPVFVGARGAAQYARWRQEAPFGCRELPRCEGQRKERVNDIWDGERVSDL